MQLTQSAVFQALFDHHREIADIRIADWFAQDAERFKRFSVQTADMLLDYSKHPVTDDTLSLLLRLAESSGLREKTEALFSGQRINLTEDRPVLHTALRAPNTGQIMVDGKNILPDIHAVRERMRHFSKNIRSGQYTGSTGKPIRDIVNIGIGGSDLGPRLCVHALQALSVSSGLRCYFVSDVDAGPLYQIFGEIDPERTLFIVSSKSFTTPETLQNANTAREWLQAQPGITDPMTHFVAATAAGKRASEWGILADRLFPLWEWVGGRYSIWSAIGLPLALMVGMDAFDAFLAGAHRMDRHFREAPFRQNMPVLMALLGIWQINFYGHHAHVIAPYAHELHYFPEYIQQLDMESNGKRVDLAGRPTDHATGPVIFGEQGCNSQHAFFQLLHQGPEVIPVDFILSGETGDNLQHHRMLTGSALSQAQALMQGRQTADPAKILPGNRPSSVLFLKKITPETLGQLLALYEHKIFVQGIIWHINSFDQWGVELGKQLLPGILNALDSAGHHATLDASTQGLIDFYRHADK